MLSSLTLPTTGPTTQSVAVLQAFPGGTSLIHCQVAYGLQELRPRQFGCGQQGGKKKAPTVTSGPRYAGTKESKELAAQVNTELELHYRFIPAGGVLEFIAPGIPFDHCRGTPTSQFTDV